MVNGVQVFVPKGRFIPGSPSSQNVPSVGWIFPGWMLTQIGYIPNVVQSTSTVEGLRQLIFIYPCALAVLAMITMGCFYNLNEKMYIRIVEEIEARKRTA